MFILTTCIHIVLDVLSAEVRLEIKDIQLKYHYLRMTLSIEKTLKIRSKKNE